VAAVAKSVSLQEFGLVIGALVDSYGIAPTIRPFAVRAATPTIVLVEAVLGMLLLGGVATRVVGWVATVLLVAMSVAVLRLASLDEPVDCGCFGGWLPQIQSVRLGATWSVARNGVMAVMCLLPWFMGIDGGRIARRDALERSLD